MACLDDYYFAAYFVWWQISTNWCDWEHKPGIFTALEETNCSYKKKVARNTHDEHEVWSDFYLISRVTWERPQPMWWSVAYVTSSLIVWYSSRIIWYIIQKMDLPVVIALVPKCISYQAALSWMQYLFLSFRYHGQYQLSTDVVWAASTSLSIFPYNKGMIKWLHDNLSKIS